MKLNMRGGIAVMAILGATLVAAGCGGGGSGASKAAKGSGGLDLVPKDAIGYVVFNTDFDSDDWKQADKLATAFKSDYKGVRAAIDKRASKSGDTTKKVNFSRDIDPWLGESGGAALLKVKGSGRTSKPSFFVWADVDDKAKFETFAKSRGMKKGAKVGDFTTWTNPDDTTRWVGVTDDLAIMTNSKAALKKTATYSGDSITDADGVTDAIDEVSDHALATLVVSGVGVRKAMANTPGMKSLASTKRVKDFTSLAVSMSAEDNGFKVEGFAAGDGDDIGDNAENDVFNELPASTLLAVGGHDFGGAIKSVANDAGTSNEQIQRGIGAMSASIGVDLDDLADAFSGDFAFAIGADDAGLGALAGGVTGAAMGGGLSALNPAAISKAASVTLAFEEKGEANETLEKIVGAAGSFFGAPLSSAKTGTSGDFTTKTINVRGFPLTTAASRDVAALSLGADVFAKWGDETLAESDTYKDAWDAADGPDSTLGSFWFDYPRIAKLAGAKSGEDATPGGWVGWAEADGSNAMFGLFMHVETK